MISIDFRNKLVPGLLALLRIAVGWHFLYEGVTKVFDPAWSSRPFLEGSGWIFGNIFRSIASHSGALQAVDFMNE